MNAAVARSRRIIERHSKSFSLASRLLPSRARDRAVVVYAYCRYVDDAIDLADQGVQGQTLRRLREELDELYRRRRSDDPLLDAFASVVEACEIPRLYPEELLAGMAMDVESHEVASMDELLLYCHRVAGTVGLMMCHVMGLYDERALENAAHLGIGMQLTNICRDVLEDWEMGRLYLPTSLLAEEGAAGLRAHLGDRFPSHYAAPVAAVVARLLARADHYYRSGDRGLPSLDWRSALAVRTAGAVYSAIGQRLRRRRCDVRAGRAYVSTHEKLVLTLDAIRRGSADLPSYVIRRLDPLGPRSSAPRRICRFPEDVSIL